MTEATQDQLLGATTPEALAALMGAADAEDKKPEGVTEAAPAAPTESATPSATSEPGPIAGVATKSGSTVLPYSVLRDARHEAAEARRRADSEAQRAVDLERQLNEAKQKLEQLAAGGTTQPAEGPSIDELIARAQTDIPELAALGQHVKDLQAKVAAAASAAPAPTAPAAPPAPTVEQEVDARMAVDEALATCPLLMQYRQTGGIVWERAKELDTQLQASPDFASKTLAERFAAVQERLAGELGVQVPKPQATTPPAPPVEPFRPNTLSDLPPGVAPQGDGQISDRMDGMALTRRFQSMTNEQIQAAIRKAG